MKTNAELMSTARERLAGSWGPAAGMTALFLLFNAAMSSLRGIGGLVSLVLTPPLWLGVAGYFLGTARGRRPPVGSMLDGFTRFGTALHAGLLMFLFTFLWSLLLVIPGIVAAFSYALTWLILVDRTDLSGGEAITASKELMRGHRWRLLGLFCRFLGWFLLAVLTLGIGFLWLVPYLQVTLALFYDELRGAEEKA